MTTTTEPSSGFRLEADWMGKRVTTFADAWPPVGVIVRGAIVGLNRAPLSLETGHYYQGRSGNRQMLRLVEAGLVEHPGPDAHIEDVAARAGFGLTDLVKRPTTAEGGLAEKELAFGRASLSRSLATKGVSLVICVFRHPVTALLGHPGVRGFQSERTSRGADVFRMSGPFAPKEEAARVTDRLAERLAVT